MKNKIRQIKQLKKLISKENENDKDIKKNTKSGKNKKYVCI